MSNMVTFWQKLISSYRRRSITKQREAVFQQHFRTPLSPPTRNCGNRFPEDPPPVYNPDNASYLEVSKPVQLPPSTAQSMENALDSARRKVTLRQRYQERGTLNLDDWHSYPDGSVIVTSAMLSHLRELDAIYPEFETKNGLQCSLANDCYNFTLRRHRSLTETGPPPSPIFEWHQERHQGRGNPPVSKDLSIEILEVGRKSFRLFERVARGSSQVILKSCMDFKIQGKSYEYWMHDKKTREVIFPCYEIMRDAAECMVEVLQAALDGYEQGYQNCLWTLFNQSSIYSDTDPNYIYSLKILDEWTRAK